MSGCASCGCMRHAAALPNADCDMMMASPSAKHGRHYAAGMDTEAQDRLVFQKLRQPHA